MADAKTPLYAGIDIGGTKIYVLITDSDGTILGSGRKKTKPEIGFEGVMERVGKALNDACKDAGVKPDKLTAVGVGAPSPILPDGTAVNAPNMPWVNVPLVPTLEKQLKCPVFAENDCNAGTLGEYALGAGQGASTLIGFFMGTGLGAGIVYQGELIVGENCQAAELGHVVVQVDGRKCGCGHRGCLEAYASKTGMGRRFAHAIYFEGRETLLVEECDGDYANVKSSILAKAWKAGDALVIETLTEAARYLGIGVGNWVSSIAPDTVVLGGGVFEALGEELLPIVQEGAKEAAHPPPSLDDTRICLAALADDAVALGAMVHAKQRFSGKVDA